MTTHRIAWLAIAALVLALTAIGAPRWIEGRSGALHADSGRSRTDGASEVLRVEPARGGPQNTVLYDDVERFDVQFRARERARIRTHLLGAERILRTADVSHLTGAQRERRARAIALLHEYRRAGVFPHNHDFPDERVPYFRDRHGTLCAMAYLIAYMGGQALVDRVARTANNAYVADLAADPEFDAWLDRNGMTVAEAARVQPAYDCWPWQLCNGAGDDPDADYAVASAGSAALGGAAIALQLTDGGAPDAWRVGLGFVAGSLGLGLGAAGLDGTNGDAKLAALNFGMGAAALGTTAWRLIRNDGAPDGVTGGEDAGGGLSWSAYPSLYGDGGAGVRVSLRF